MKKQNQTNGDVAYKSKLKLTSKFFSLLLSLLMVLSILPSNIFAENNTVETITANLTIDFQSIYNHPEKLTDPDLRDKIPEGGYLAKFEDIDMPAHSTAMDLLEHYLDTNNITYENRGGYISQIDGFGEFDAGMMSGWMYWANGQLPGFGAADYDLQDGDEIIWQYVTNYTDNSGYPGKKYKNPELTIDLSDLKTYLPIIEDKTVAANIPDSAYLAKDAALDITETSQALDIITKYLKEQNIPYEISNGYIASINHLPAGLAGPYSGWMYSINDKIPDVGLAQYKLKKGDKIKIYYATDYNVDVNFYNYYKDDSGSSEVASWTGKLAEVKESWGAEKLVKYKLDMTPLAAIQDFAELNNYGVSIKDYGLGLQVYQMNNLPLEPNPETAAAPNYTIYINGEKCSEPAAATLKPNDIIDVYYKDVLPTVTTNTVNLKISNDTMTSAEGAPFTGDLYAQDIKISAQVKTVSELLQLLSSQTDSKVKANIIGADTSLPMLKDINGLANDSSDENLLRAWYLRINDGEWDSECDLSKTIKAGDKIELTYTKESPVYFTFTNNLISAADGAAWSGERNFKDWIIEPLESESKTIYQSLSANKELKVEFTANTADTAKIKAIDGLAAGEENVWCITVNGKKAKNALATQLSANDKVNIVLQKADEPATDEKTVKLELFNYAYPEKDGAPWYGTINYEYKFAQDKELTLYDVLNEFAAQTGKQLVIRDLHKPTEELTVVDGIDTNKLNADHKDKKYKWSVTISGAKAEASFNTIINDKDIIYIDLKVKDVIEPTRRSDKAAGDFAIVDSYWPSFRGNEDNNAVRTAQPKSPTNLDDLKTVKQVFAQKYSNFAPGQGIFINNEYTFVGYDKLLAINPETGEILRELKLPNGLGLASSAPLYAEGRIFIPIDNSQVVSFPYSLWTSEYKDVLEVPGAWIYRDPDNYNLQTQTPLAYHDGKVILALTNYNPRLNVTAPVIAIDAKTGDALWKKDIPGGFYFSGGIIADDFYISGSDYGRLLVMNINTGAIVDFVDLSNGTNLTQIRSTVVRDHNEYYVVATTKDNSGSELIKFTVAANGKISIIYKTAIDVRSTATVVVNNGRIYWGTNDDEFLVLDAKDGKIIRKISYPNTFFGVQGSPLVITDPDSKTKDVYVFFVVNDNAGALYAFKDNPEMTDNAEAKLVYQADEKIRNYNRNSVFMNSDGTIYYSLDSGYLIALNGVRAVTPHEPEDHEQEEDNNEIIFVVNGQIVKASKKSAQINLSAEVNGAKIDFEILPNCFDQDKVYLDVSEVKRELAGYKLKSYSIKFTNDKGEPLDVKQDIKISYPTTGFSPDKAKIYYQDIKPENLVKSEFSGARVYFMVHSSSEYLLAEAVNTPKPTSTENTGNTKNTNNTGASSNSTSQNTKDTESTKITVRPEETETESKASKNPAAKTGSRAYETVIAVVVINILAALVLIEKKQRAKTVKATSKAQIESKQIDNVGNDYSNVE